MTITTETGRIAALWSLVLFGVVSGCGSNEGPTGTVCTGEAGGVADLSAEPNYSATYLHRWALAGCLVRLDVLMTRTSGCLPEDMVMGSPLGTSTVNGAGRIYVRGETTQFGGGASGYLPNTSLPGEATDTGYRQGARELWMLPDNDTFVFVRYTDDGHVEAWPRDTAPAGCA
jgi:hypothetical protein